MKTEKLIYPKQEFINLAPLAARYEVLTRAVLAYLATGQSALVLRYSRELLRLAKTFTKLDRQNVLLRRKLAMLCHAPWRERVLKELGGLRRLKMWEVARKRVLARGEKPLNKAKPSEPSWLFTPERIAESERLKAHARKYARAGLSPNVFRDRVKMDFEGQFRLPPLPRVKKGGRQVKAYTQNSIVDYDFNPVPFEEFKGFGPAMVWPQEFYAAMGIDKPHSVIPHQGFLRSESRWMGDQITKHMIKTLDPPSSACGLVRDDNKKREDGNRAEGRPALSLRDILTLKTYRSIFENPV